jgi:hypothetical protein
MTGIFKRQHLNSEFIQIERECREFELSKVETVNFAIGNKSEWLTYTAINNSKPISTKSPFQFAASFDEDDRLVFYGKYENAHLVSGLFLKQYKQMPLFKGRLTSVTFKKGDGCLIVIGEKTVMWHKASARIMSGFLAR